MKFYHLSGGQHIDFELYRKKTVIPQLSFKRKYLRTAAAFCTALILYGVSAVLTGFMPVKAVIGIPAGFYWLIRNFCPTRDSFTVLPLVLKTLLHTSVIAITASTAAAVAACAAATAAAQTTGRFRILGTVLAVTAAFFRNIPLPAWSILLLLSFKQNQATGFFALFFVTMGHLTRAFTEIIDAHAEDSYIALEAAGIPYISIIVHGVLPNTIPLFISWLLYAIETNVRDSALIGILTGTGIGFLFNLYFKSFRYAEAGLIICVLLITVLGIDAISHAVRRILL